MSIRAIDVAYNCLLNQKEGMTFKELWAVVKEQLGYDDVVAGKKVSQFYTNLSLDGRFASLENNVWNLKVHCKYNDVAVKDEDFEEPEEEEDEDSLEDEEDDEEEVIDEELNEDEF
jgi:DNA-directed RNA polymerase subunit delta